MPVIVESRMQLSLASMRADLRRLSLEEDRPVRWNGVSMESSRSRSIQRGRALKGSTFPRIEAEWNLRAVQSLTGRLTPSVIPGLSSSYLCSEPFDIYRMILLKKLEIGDR